MRAGGRPKDTGGPRFASQLYEGTAERPGLAALTTVHGRTTVNVNAAPAPVLAALGLADAAIADIVQSRVRAPYTVVPGQHGGRGLGVTSNTFRIEAEGWVTEARKVRIVAVVQRRAPQPSSAETAPLTALGLAILSWRMGDTR